MKFRFVYWLSLIALTGCQVGSKYQKPVVSIPSEWKGPYVAKKEPLVDHWWEVFEDPELNLYEKKVLDRSWDLYVAIQKVIEARALAGISKSQLYPQLNANANYAFFQDFLKIKNFGKTKPLFPSNKVTVYGQEFLFPSLFSYELDLWGKYRAQYHSALLKTESIEEEMKSTVLTLTSECASYYYNLRSLDTSITFLEKLKANLKERCDLERLRWEKGLVSELNYNALEQSLHQLEINIDETHKQRKKFESALATLVGENASLFQFKKGTQLLKNAPSIPAGLPSTLLLRRPDVMQAERELASFHSQVNASKANYFPSFNLTSGLGVFSITLQDLFSIKSFLWQAGASVAQFIYDAGKRKNDLEAAKARFRQAEGGYQQKILKAFEEVEMSLSNLYEENLQYQAYQKNLDLAARNAFLTQKKWNCGLANKVELLEQESLKIQKEQSVLFSRASLYQSTIELVKSIGGSFK